MEELFRDLSEEDIKLRLIDVPSDYYDGVRGERFIKVLHDFIE